MLFVLLRLFSKSRKLPSVVQRRDNLRTDRRILLRALGGERTGSFQGRSLQSLVEVLQPVAVPVDVEDAGLVEEAVQDRGRPPRKPMATPFSGAARLRQDIVQHP